MSLLICSIDKDGLSARVGCDTEAIRRADGALFQVAKMAPLVIHPAVLAGRGQPGFAHIVYLTCAMTPGDFDDVLDAMSTILPIAFKSFEAYLAALGETASELQLLVAVGWSNRQGRMVGREYDQKSVASGFVAQDMGPYHVSPWYADMEHANLDPSSPGMMAEIAKAQVRYLARTEPTASGGGSFIVAELSRQGIRTKTICDLDIVRGRVAA